MAGYFSNTWARRSTKTKILAEKKLRESHTGLPKDIDLMKVPAGEKVKTKKKPYESDVELSPDSVDHLPLIERIRRRPEPLSVKICRVLVRAFFLILGFNIGVWLQWTHEWYVLQCAIQELTAEGVMGGKAQEGQSSFLQSSKVEKGKHHVLY